jgi:hypothetical protein
VLWCGCWVLEDAREGERGHSTSSLRDQRGRGRGRDRAIEAVEASTSDAVLPLLSVAFPSVSNKVFGARALLDTGALGANLITPSLAQTLVQLALAETVEEDIIVCPAFGPCKTFKQKLKFTYGSL